MSNSLPQGTCTASAHAVPTEETQDAPPPVLELYIRDEVTASQQAELLRAQSLATELRQRIWELEGTVERQRKEIAEYHRMRKVAKKTTKEDNAQRTQNNNVRTPTSAPTPAHPRQRLLKHRGAV